MWSRNSMKVYALLMIHFKPLHLQLLSITYRNLFISTYLLRVKLEASALMAGSRKLLG